MTSSPSSSEAVARPLVLRPALVLVALALLAFNLRTPTASLPPLLGSIEKAFGLSGAAAGLLTALPVLCMALCAPTAYRLSHRIGAELATLWAIVLVAAGTLLRLGGEVALFGGTLVAGVGIAIAGVTLPSIIKDRFATRPGVATAAYSVPMMLGAAVGPALAVPLADSLGSWQASLAAWSLPALVAAVLWAPLARRSREATVASRLPWRSRGAWLLALFLSLQSFLAYAYLAWLPPAFESRGWPGERAGALLAVLHVGQLVTALVLPALADLSRDRRPALVGAVACTVLGACGLAFGAAPWPATIVLGLGLGGGFSLALVVLADLAATPAAAAGLAAMTFLICYSTAALAPVLVGAAHDATGGFTVPFTALALVACLELAVATRLRPALKGSVR